MQSTNGHIFSNLKHPAYTPRVSNNTCPSPPPPTHRPTHTHHTCAPVRLKLWLALRPIKQAVLSLKVTKHHVTTRRLQAAGSEVNQAHPDKQCGQTGRQANRQTGRQADNADSQAGKQTGKQADRQTGETGQQQHAGRTLAGKPNDMRAGLPGHTPLLPAIYQNF